MKSIAKDERNDFACQNESLEKQQQPGHSLVEILHDGQTQWRGASSEISMSSTGGLQLNKNFFYIIDNLREVL